ncbi:MAG: ABC transporter substrate-binding protein [Alphaproteobacteria bacterium]
MASGAPDSMCWSGSRRGFSGAAALLGLALAALPAGAAGRPARVVSINLCADQLVLRLADRAQIASVSWLAAEPGRSAMARAVGDLPLNRGTAEEVIRHDPDLVIAGRHSARPAVAALRRLGRRVLDLALPTDFAAIGAQIRRVATALGQPARGAALIAQMERRLARLKPPGVRVRPVAVFYQPHGFASGPGSFEHALLGAAGFDNLARRLGLGPLGHVPLERLIAARPDMIVNWSGQDARPSLARDTYRHPALGRLIPPIPVAVLPAMLWSCASWYSVAAVERLAALRESLGR